jgi:hypothetical protein
VRARLPCPRREKPRAHFPVSRALAMLIDDAPRAKKSARSVCIW